MSSSVQQQRLALLPSSVSLTPSASPHAFLRLPHPRTLRPTLYLPYPGGLLEVQQIRPDTDKSRSWFVDQAVVSDGSLTVLTPFDPLFLVISLLSHLPAARQTNYLSLPDLFDALSTLKYAPPISSDGGKGKGKEENEEEEEEGEMAEDIVKLGALECVKQRLDKCCEIQEYEGTTLYRLSLPLTIALLQAKVDRLASGLYGAYESTSLAEVTPVGKEEDGSKDDKKFPTVSRGLGREGAGDGKGFSEELQLETRQKNSIAILANYLPPALAHKLSDTYSFKALKLHLATHTTSSVLSTTYLPGRGSSNGGEPSGGGTAAAERAKKVKAENAKKSRGVRELESVNKKGMQTLTAMFAKKPAVKK
ncbi:ribonuclease H2, subunit B [Pseudohyphozyma bogoriensis]|nr:ribonuclease H2, subunit B [Pseudohyphozyma bogoriensis]